MKWSLSTARMFNRCQRQWFYRSLANANAKKEPLRRRLYLLGKLQSISAWRGSLVDLVIERAVVPVLRLHRLPDQNEVFRTARVLFEQQLTTARKHSLFEPGFSPKQLGDAFAALHCMEYGEGISDTEVEKSWQEVEQAISNMLSMGDLLSRLASATHLFAQRSLSLQHSGVSVQAVPDLIAFYGDKPPLIVDWKVHTFGIVDAWLQLAIYAIALVRGAPHIDFPVQLQKWTEKDIQLVEAQLLTNRLRCHDIGPDEILEAEGFIAASAETMLISMQGKKSGELTDSDFPTTSSPDTCTRCAYRVICWKESPQWTSQQTSFQL